jgi:hypothetical protein
MQLGHLILSSSSVSVFRGLPKFATSRPFLHQTETKPRSHCSKSRHSMPVREFGKNFVSFSLALIQGREGLVVRDSLD